MRQFCADRALAPPGETLLVAVSGGPDSLALLQLLARIRDQLGTALVAAYIDHGVRPAEAIAAERAFVAGEARALGLAFLTATIEADERRRSPEEALRLGRYRALARLATEAGASAVATGHTATDQAETVLLRLLRGSGLSGLGAMQPASRWPLPLRGAPRLVRPLLTLSRTETLAYCQALGLTPRIDPENENPRYQRTRIRAELLPALRAFNPSVEQALVSLAEEATEWRQALAQAEQPSPSGASTAPDSTAQRPAPVSVAVARRQFRSDPTSGDLVADVTTLRALDPARRTMALRSLLAAALPERIAPARAHLLALERLVMGTNDGTLTLPGDRRANRAGDQLRIGPGITVRPVNCAPDIALPVPGEVEFGGWRIRAWADDGETVAPADADGRWRVRLDPAAAAGLSVGGRRSGDRIALPAGAGHTTLQNLFVNAKAPRAARPGWPVFRTERGIVWVAGLRVAGWARAERGAAVVIEAQTPASARQ